MTFRKILTTNPLEFINSLVDIKAEYERYILIAREIEAAEKALPTRLDISLPNIRFIIGGEYDREKNSIFIDKRLILSANDIEVFLSSNTKASGVSAKTVLVNTQFKEGVLPLSGDLLKKGLSSYDVAWFYDTREVEDNDQSPSTDIPSFRYAASKRFLKKKEFFSELHILSPDTSTDGVVSFGITEAGLNRLDFPDVICLPREVIGGEVFSTEKNTAIRVEPVGFTANHVKVSRKLKIEELSLLGVTEGDSLFLRSSLSNCKRGHIVENMSPSIDEVISSKYMDSVVSSLYPVDRKNLPFNTTVVGGDDHSICSNSSFATIARLKAEETYAKLLKIKIQGKDDSTLGELMAYLQSKLDELRNKFVKRDECASIPLNNIDEGCKISCDTISLDDRNLMVTKQKLQGVIICALNCN